MRFGRMKIDGRRFDPDTGLEYDENDRIAAWRPVGYYKWYRRLWRFLCRLLRIPYKDPSLVQDDPDKRPRYIEGCRGMGWVEFDGETEYLHSQRMPENLAMEIRLEDNKE